jgi:uncharacterized membrane protein
LAQKSYVTDTSRSYGFVLLYSIFQILIFLVIPPYGHYHFDLKIAVYPFYFAIFSLTAQMLMLNALRNGPTSLTNILLRYHALVPTAVGIFLWHESLSDYQLGGLLLFLICTFLFNHDSYTEGNKNKPISWHWLLVTLLSALGTGIAVIFTKQYMVTSTGPIREYLILFNIFIVLFCIIVLACQRLRGTIIPRPAPQFIGYIFFAALLMNTSNYIYMDYIAKYNSAFFFPATNISSLLAILILSVIIFNERLNRKAQMGIILSIIAICLLSLH